MHDLGFLDALGLDETTLSQVSQVAPKNLIQPRANKDAMSQVSQVVSSENIDMVSEKEKLPLRGEGGGQEIKSAAEPDYLAGYAVGFLHCWHMLFDAGVLVHGAQQASGYDRRTTPRRPAPVLLALWPGIFATGNRARW